MNIRKICYLTLLFLILCNCCVYSEQKEIICNTSFARNTLTVAGRLTGVTQEQEVVLLVGDWDNIVHIEQVTSDANGNFSFQFDVSETLPSGYY